MPARVEEGAAAGAWKANGWPWGVGRRRRRLATRRRAAQSPPHLLYTAAHLQRGRPDPMLVGLWMGGSGVCEVGHAGSGASSVIREVKIAATSTPGGGYGDCKLAGGEG